MTNSPRPDGLAFTDCEVCPTCGSTETRIIYRRLIDGVYERRHACKVGDPERCERWNSYQSRLDPRKVRHRVKPSLPVEIRDLNP